MWFTFVPTSLFFPSEGQSSKIFLSQAMKSLPVFWRKGLGCATLGISFLLEKNTWRSSWDLSCIFSHTFPASIFDLDHSFCGSGFVSDLPCCFPWRKEIECQIYAHHLKLKYPGKYFKTIDACIIISLPKTAFPNGAPKHLYFLNLSQYKAKFNSHWTTIPVF